ncbi:unnamed protein product [Rhizoctonia solani]|uniref:Uncharacterized protein n=1 Tax=Rhizoctonia solani TaxID=456999 RepID=A0A8H3DMX2_9AGAM|nr:unnamed protein product [Rhizoctonia solani]
MRVENQMPRLFREESVEPIDMFFIKDKGDSLDKSSSQGAPTGKSTPPASLPVQAGNSKNHRSGLPLRRASASQPGQSSRSLRPRNETKLTLRRASSVIQPSPSMGSLAATTGKAPVNKTARKASGKRKLEAPEDGPRVRKKLSPPLSEKSENTSRTVTPSEPMPGRTNDGKIDYRYYVAKYLNQKRKTTN